MALNCPSSDYCTGKMLGYGCWSEEVSPLSSCGVSSLWWDELDLEMELDATMVVEEEEESELVADLPNDPFGMNLEAASAEDGEMNLEAMSDEEPLDWCIEDCAARFGGQPFESGVERILFDLIEFAIDEDMDVVEGPLVSGGPSGNGDASQLSWLSPNASVLQPCEFAENPSSSQSAILEYCDAVSAASRMFAENPSMSQDAALSWSEAVSAAPSWFSESPASSQDAVLACCDAVGASSGQEGNDAHPGMLFAIGYLGLRDILSCEMVCKSLRSAVRSELCSWKCIHIDSQLGDKICDADLLRLTQKSPGDMQCLNLVRCRNITDDGLKAVLQSNPQLTKLGIFGNVRMTHQGLIDNLRSFNMEARIGIKKLRIANLATLTEVQYEELLSLLKMDKRMALHKQEPRIFHADCFLPDHHGRCAPDCFIPDVHYEYALDVERCPLCERYKLVYDCPVEGCNNSRSGGCRGCIVCILRCLQCGECIDSEYDETFSLDNLCRRCQMNEDSHVAEK